MTVIKAISLEKYLTQSVKIECGNCRKSASFPVDISNGSSLFYEIGWREFNNKPHCPTCAKNFAIQLN